jgi:ubiquitin C-terminal hydrolase
LQILKPQDSRLLSEAVEPPTSLENLLQAYVEEEQLTGANQWRCAHVAVPLPCCASF